MDLTLHLWHLWLLAAVGAAALELHLGNFVLIWFALGAVSAGLGSFLGASVNVQLLVFLATSIVLFASSRTIFRRLIAPHADRMRHGDAAMLGLEAVVVEPLGEKSGAVRVHGELWSARSLEGEIAAGERVQIERVEGLTLHVRRARETLWVALPGKESKR